MTQYSSDKEAADEQLQADRNLTPEITKVIVGPDVGG